MKRGRRLVQVTLHSDGFVRSFDDKSEEPEEFQGFIWDIGERLLKAVTEDTRVYADISYRGGKGNEEIHRYTLGLVVRHVLCASYVVLTRKGS